MWHVAAGLDWDAIAELSQPWANAYELALARDFVDHLDALPSGRPADLLPDERDGRAGEPMAAALKKALEREDGAGLARRWAYRRGRGTGAGLPGPLKADEAMVQVAAATPAEGWVPFGKFAVPLRGHGEVDRRSSPTRWPRACWAGWSGPQLVKGPRPRGS